ncbi:MAG: DinB family protein [Pirellulales bacterium]
MDVYEYYDFSRGMTDMIIGKYLDDLNDAEFLLRPHPKSHHIAFQLGHLISSEAQIIEAIAPGKSIPLPVGFHETYTKANECSDDPSKFLTKAEYLRLYRESSANTAAVVRTLAPRHWMPKARRDCGRLCRRSEIFSACSHNTLCCTPGSSSRSGARRASRSWCDEPRVFDDLFFRTIHHAFRFDLDDRLSLLCGFVYGRSLRGRSGTED